jgi:hypothetical protein
LQSVYGELKRICGEFSGALQERLALLPSPVDVKMKLCGSDGNEVSLPFTLFNARVPRITPHFEASSTVTQPGQSEI